ncbi:MAG: Flp pilus assembly complex ATPase component TadA [Phycisphaerales bacterium]|nr:Flp pilus assembly complex ATPase component TadA [Phycisphaerales bacterium]
MSTVQSLLADSGAFLVSPWKPLLMWGVMVAWGWLVGTKLYPDTVRLRQGHHGWSWVWILTGTLGLAVMLLGWRFYVSIFAGAIVMLIPVLVYWRIRNAAVDDSQKFHLSFKKDEAAKAKKVAKKAAANAQLQFSGDAGTIPVPDKDDPLLATWLALESLLMPTLENGGTRVDLALGGGGLASTSMVHTVRSRQETIAGEEGMRVINLIKEMAGLDQSETRKRQSGQITVSGEAGRHTLDVSFSGSSKGISGRIDVDRSKSSIMTPQALGLLPRQIEALEHLVPEEQRHGIVLIAGPMNSGLTTSGYALTGMHDAYLSMIKTLEYQIEGRLEGVDQVIFDPQTGESSYGTNLQSILRRDPDVVLAEIRDAESAQVAARAGEDTTLQMLQIRADSAATAIREWVRLVGDVPLAAKGLRCVVAERLIRVLCHDCRQAVKPADPKRLGLPPEGVIYRAGGKVQVKNRVEDCPTCRGGGFTGVTGIFEVMQVTADIRRLLSNGDLQGAMAQARRDRMILLQESGLRRVADGVTSLEEVQRVLTPPRKQAPKSAAQGASS